MKIHVQISCAAIIVFLLFASAANAQNTTPHFGMDVGTSFAMSGSYGSMFSQALAPRLSWDLTKDFQLVAGTVFSTARVSGFSNQSSYIHGGQPLFGYDGARTFSSTVYAFGVYHVSPKLSITGGTWFENINTPEKEGFMNPYAMQQNPRGMSLGLDYRVNENVRFGVEVSASTGHSPFYPASFQQSPFHSNFNSNRMFRNHSQW